MADFKNKSRQQLKFLCFGAGAIGSYIGCSLLRCGQKVTFLEQPSAASLLQQNGLRLRIGADLITFPEVEVASTLEKALTYGPYDLGILAVKSYDTKPLAESLRPYHAALPPIISFQNGVENEMILEEILGPNKVIPATVTTAIGRNQAGDVFIERKRGIGIASDHYLIPALMEVLRCAELNPCIYPDAVSMKWSKMITNLLANASSAILNLTPGQIFADRRLYHIEVLQIKETLAVMRALNISVTNLPATPVKLLCACMSKLPEVVSRPILARSVGKGRGEKMPSFHIDLYQGRTKSEVEFLNGAVVRYAKRCGIKTPVNQYLTETLMKLTTKEIQLEMYAHNPVLFLREIGERLS